MKKKFKADTASITEYNYECINRAMAEYKNLTTDSDRRRRTAKQVCIVCYYIKNHALIGDGGCKVCGKRTKWVDGYEPAVCKRCAKKHGLCRICGGDIKLDGKRREYEFETL